MPPNATPPGEPKDERADFFLDLRALRVRQGLSLADIAARAHFSADALADVESGPALPSLPRLEAYLRACGEPLDRWEDRWRRLVADSDRGTHDAAASDAAANDAAGFDAAANAAADNAVARDAAVSDAARGAPYPGRTSGAGLPLREPGSSPLAEAGAALAKPGIGTAPHPIKRLGPGGQRLGPGGQRGRRPRVAGPARTPSRRGRARWYLSATAAAVLLGSGVAVALLARPGPAGRHAPGTAAPPDRAGASTAPTATDGQGARPSPVPVWSLGVRPVILRGAQDRLVTGVGCPTGPGAGVVVANALRGPGWTTSGGGWTGDGCDGSSLWTMDPNGKQSAPSALTWKFSLANPVSHCSLAVFVPTANALGVGDYTVFTGSAASTTGIATVPVSQAAATGRWVTLGDFSVRGSTLEIQVVPDAATTALRAPGRGHNAAIAASAASAACA